jgi:hypothetical protein
MSEHDDECSGGLLQDERGVAYVERILMVCVGLCLAAFLVTAGNLVFAPRFQRAADVLYSDSP